MDQMQVKAAEKAQNRMSRELDSRAVMQRPTAWRPPETLPMPDERPGWKHRYVRISTLGTADPSNISSKLREGYEPCKADEYPELMMHATTEGRFKGNIEVGGLVLCSIPTEFLKQREAHFSKINKDTMESVDNNFMKDSHPTMSKFSEKSTKVTFGSGT